MKLKFLYPRAVADVKFAEAVMLLGLNSFTNSFSIYDWTILSGKRKISKLYKFKFDIVEFPPILSLV
jgi:hypothetical protein